MRDDERNGQEGRGGVKTARNGAGSGMSREEAARKGGEAVSQNRDHMASIGRKGGEAVSRNREHMAEIGRLGAEARNAQRNRGGRNESGRGAERRNGENEE